MDTAEISYRVADFLKQYPPFTAIDDADLLALAARGRVRFHEPSEYLLWQGEPHRQHVFVIQQGTVSLWEDAGGRSTLRDVRGTGDMLGTERYTDAPRCAHTARSESEVLIYAFPADDFTAVHPEVSARRNSTSRPTAAERRTIKVPRHDAIRTARSSTPSWDSSRCRRAWRPTRWRTCRGGC